VIDHVSHAYGTLRVLQDVSFRIQSGEIISVLGPSGCGKTTLLRIVGGLERPAAGEVRVHGEPSPGSLNPVTYVFQDRTLVPWMTVTENVEFPLRRSRLSSAERRNAARSMLVTVGLGDFADAYPKALSGGMQQRVAFARALVVRPSVLLMDEPLSALDGKAKADLVSCFLDLWREMRFSAVYVTHSVAEATWLGHRVLVLTDRPGRVQEIIEIDTPPGNRGLDRSHLEETRSRLGYLVDPYRLG
jgi:NitT/TauT family transport system ATP-binding protein